MKIILSHPTGNANVKAAAYGFIEADLLARFHVSLAAFPGTLLDRLSNIRFFSEIKRRMFDSSLQPFTRPWPWLEIGRLLSPKMGLGGLTLENGPFYIDKVCTNLDKRVASRLKYAPGVGASAVYAYEDVAGFSFQAAKHAGLQCLYDLPIGYWRSAWRLLETERQRWPEWENTLIGFRDPEIKLERKDQELRMADRIFVASTFTAHTLKECPYALAPIEVIPYGFPPVTNEVKQYSKRPGRSPLKLLFVGSLTQRKGIANLFEAVKDFKGHVQLTIVGNKQPGTCLPLDNALQLHHWIPSLSHDNILKLMRESDVLIFPSLFEGFGLVITEAMSQGTPVITTERTAGPDLIKHDQNGWLIKAGSVEAIRETIEKLLILPAVIEETGRQAMETARLRPWKMYGKDLANAVRKHFSTNN